MDSEHKSKSEEAVVETNSSEKSQHGSKQNKNANQSNKSSRPQREIYRPPSLRSKSSRNVNAGSNHNHHNQSGNSHKGNGNHANKNGIMNNSINPSMQPISPHSNRRQFPQPFVNGNIGVNSSAPPPQLQSSRNNLPINNNATSQDYQLTASQQQQIQNQQLANLLGQLELNNLQGLYSLQQSKSLGNNLNALLQQHAHHQNLSMGKQVPPPQFNGGLGGALAFLQQTQRSQAILAAANNNPHNFSHQSQNHEDGGQFNRLSQSKSSGSIPDGLSKPRVRFDLESVNDSRRGMDEATANMIKNAESRFSNLNGCIPQQQQRSQVTPQQKQQLPVLQKSRTGFVLNLYAQQQQNSQKYVKQEGYAQNNNNNGLIKRSRSFGAQQRHHGENNNGSWRQQQGGGGGVPLTHAVHLSSVHSVYSDFRISKWPKRVQETVTAAVTAVDRVAARQQIEMVNMIFDAMLMEEPKNNQNPVKLDVQPPREKEEIIGADDLRDANISTEKANDSLIILENDALLFEPHDNDGDDDLSTPAVHIFLYFIQKEKDRTVMESLLNTCFATFQKLFGTNARNTTTNLLSPAILAAQSMIFLRFISCLYSQVKLYRRQKPGGRSLDEMSFSVLSILCDSCLAMLRSQLSSDPESMDCLFTVMTSQGRDIESSFPLKMKQLLAGVRDALLGIGPYSQGPLCSTVQKTLMQLIELHAASWNLPASAVRYYYSNSGGHNNNHNNAKNNLSST